MTDARINIIADDNQVDALVQSMNNLQESLQSVINSMNQTQAEARQTGNAMQGAANQTRGATSTISQSANRGSTALNGMGGSAIRAAGGLRGIAAASAAAAGPLIAGVATVEALKTALTGTVTAINAYLQSSPQMLAQLNQLKQAGTGLQTAFGGFAFELVGGTDLLETLIDIAETGVDIFESLTEQVSDTGDAFTFSSVAIEVFRRSVAAIYSLVVITSATVASLANGLQLLVDLDFSRFQERQRDISRTFREQSREVYNLAEGLNEVRRTGDSGPIDIHLRTVSGGGAGGEGSIEEQVVESTIDSIDKMIEVNREALDETVAAIRDLYKRGVLGVTMTKAEEESLLDLLVGPRFERDIAVSGARRQQAGEAVFRNLQEAAALDPQVNQLRQDLISAIERETQARAGAAAAEAQLAQNRAAIARNAAVLGTPLPSIPGVEPLGGLLPGAAMGAGGTAVGGAAVSLAANTLFNQAFRTLVAEQVGVLGIRGAVGPIARGALTGMGQGLFTPLGAFGAAAGAVGGTARAYSLEVDRQNQAQNEQFAAMVRQQEAAALRGQLLNRNLELQSAGARQLAEAEQALADAEFNRMNIQDRLADSEYRALELREMSEQSVRDYAQANEESGKIYLQDLAERLEADREYFDFIQRSILGTKEEARLFAEAIAGTGFEEAFRNLATAGADPATALALTAGVETSNLGFGFQPSLDLDLEGIRRFRDLSEDSFPSAALHLKAINDQLRENERRWAQANGGIGEYIKSIERSEEKVKDAFKQDAIDGFTSSIENIGSFLGQTLVQSFDDGLTGAERAKAFLAGMLGDFLQTIGSTAIAQGAIIAFGDPAVGGLPNPARAAGLIAAGTAAVIAGSALSGVASNIQRSGAGAGAGAAATPGTTGAAQSTTNVFIENRFGNRFDARELDRSANETFRRAAEAGQ